MAGDARSDGWGKLYQFEVDAVCARVNASAATVYFALVSLRNAQMGETPPVGLALIASKTNQGPRTVQRGLKSLVDAGLIERLGGGHRPRYRFPLLNRVKSDVV